MLHLNWISSTKIHQRNFKTFFMHFFHIFLYKSYHRQMFVNKFFYLNLFSSIRVIERTKHLWCDPATLSIDIISVKWLCHRNINHTIGYFARTFSLLAFWWNILSNSGNFNCYKHLLLIVRIWKWWKSVAIMATLQHVLCMWQVTL